MVPPPDDTPESLDGQATSGGEPDRPVEKSIGEGETAGNDPSTDSTGTDFDENWTPPEMLADRYRLEDELGRGGMGVVYRATDTQLDRSIAVKLISRGSVARFETEAKAIAALNHPNIAHVYEFNQQDGLYYIVMEHVEGESLSQRLDREGTIPGEEALRITVALCDALSHAHGKGIIHRDIKPSNVLLSDEGVPKMVDFGLARIESHQGQHTRAGAMLGTIDYMSPEQRRDAAGADHRSDLWSLAASLYHMVTGRIPRVIQLRDLADSLQEVLGKALEDAPDSRYQSADDFRDALKVALDSPVAHQPRTVSEGELAKGQCTQCGVVNDLTRKFCEECAAALRVSCLSCEQQIPVWDEVCGECGGRQAELLKEQERVARLLDEAEEHRLSHDYASAAQTLQRIPEPLRTSEMSDLLIEMERTACELTELLATIRERIGNKDLKGLIPQVTRALELRPDREDLQKIKGQLQERQGHGRLTKEFALKKTDSLDRDLDWTAFTTIDDNAAEILCRYERLKLDLSGLTSLSDVAAKILSKFEGDLTFNGLTSLSDSAAESLSIHQEGLTLNGLTSLPDSTVEILSKRWGELGLNGLTSLSDAAAESLSKHEGERLYLDGLRSLSDAAAESLGKHKGDLSLDGLTSLSDAAAESLGKHKGDLSLDGLTSLSDAAAESLSEHVGYLALDGLTSLSDAAAESLSKHKGEGLSFEGLTSLSDTAAESLSKHKGGQLAFLGLTSLSDAAAKSLSKHEGELLINEWDLPESAAEILRQHPSF